MIMAFTSQFVSALTDGPAWVTLLSKVTLLMAIAWLVHFAIAKLNPAWRVLLWRASVIGILAVTLVDVSRVVSLPLEVSIDVAKIESRSVVADPQMATVANRVESPVVVESSLHQKASTLAEGLSVASVPTAIEPAIKLNAPISDPWTSRVSWPTILGLVWLLGILWRIFTVVVGRIRLNGIIQKSREAGGRISKRSSAVGSHMGVGKFAIRISNQIDSPMVCRSSFGKTLVIPDAVVESSSQREMDAILAHEFSHLASCDLEWNSIIKFVTVFLFWPHPLMWFVQKSHSRACEYIADSESARFIADAQLYVRTLAKIAIANMENASNQKQLPVVSMARSSDIRNRLERVGKSIKQLPLSRSKILLGFLSVVLAFTVVGAFQLVNASTSVEDDTDQYEVLVRIVDDSGQPIDAALQVTSYTVDIQSELDVVSTREDRGVFRVSFPKEYGAVQMLATSPDHVRIMTAFRHEEVDIMPKTHEIVLPKGTKISGRVVDEQGDPIESVKVSLLVPTNQKLKSYPFYYYYSVDTDADGRWISNAMPAKLDDVWMKFEHADFISDPSFNATIQSPSIAKLRAGTLVAEMKKGTAVAGSAQNQLGEPVAASVFAGMGGRSATYRKTATNMGEFRLDHCQPGSMVLIAVAPGFAPDSKTIEVAQEEERVSFSLEPGRKIAIKVEDVDGNPIPRAGINIVNWRGHRNPFGNEPRRLTNPDGVWEWNDAPSDEVTFNIFKKGFVSKNNFTASADHNNPYVVRLMPQLLVSGKVTDATTGKPVKKFKVIPGIHWEENEAITWEQRNSKSCTDGKYEFPFSYPRHGHSVRIESLGYQITDSRKFNSNEGRVSFDFRLEPDATMTGVVTTPDDQPAVGAMVYVAVPNKMNKVINGRVRNPFRSTTTDEAGRFSLPREKQDFKLLISHELGVIEVNGKDFQPGGEFKLLPWGKVEGTVYQSGTIASKAKVDLADLDSDFRNPNFIQGGFSAIQVSDEDGKFEFDRLIPGRKLRFARAVESGSGDEYRMSFTDGVNVKIEAGKTHTVSVGGDGRRVVGRFEVPSDHLQYSWQFTHVKADVLMPKFPAGMRDWPPEKQQKWKTEWDKSPEGIACAKAQSVHYSFAVKENGSFQIDDMLEGSYELKATIVPPRGDKTYATGVTLGSVRHKFAVDGGNSASKPLDLGEIALELHQRLKPGDSTPELTFQTLDGESVSLADLRGKVVLIDFWATWCGPCRELIPRLEKLHGQYKDRKDFVMVSIDVYEDVEKLKTWLAEHPHEWMQAKLDEDSEASVAEAFGFQGIPAVFLIDRKGKIAAANIFGREIDQAIKKQFEEDQAK